MNTFSRQKLILFFMLFDRQSAFTYGFNVVILKKFILLFFSSLHIMLPYCIVTRERLLPLGKYVFAFCWEPVCMGRVIT